MSETRLCSGNLCLTMLRGMPQKHSHLIAAKWAPGYLTQFPTNRRLTAAIRDVFKRKDFSLSFGERRRILTITVRKAFSISERQKLIPAIDSVTSVDYTPLGPDD